MEAGKTEFDRFHVNIRLAHGVLLSNRAELLRMDTRSSQELAVVAIIMGNAVFGGVELGHIRNVHVQRKAGRFDGRCRVLE